MLRILWDMKRQRDEFTIGRNLKADVETTRAMMGTKVLIIGETRSFNGSIGHNSSMPVFFDSGLVSVLNFARLVESLAMDFFAIKTKNMACLRVHFGDRVPSQHVIICFFDIVTVLLLPLLSVL